MQLKMRQIKGLTIGAASLVCIIAFQNCSPANFVGQAGNPVVFTSMTPDAAEDLVRDPGIDPNTDGDSDPVSDPVAGPVSDPVSDPVAGPVSDPVADPVVSDPGKRPSKDPISDEEPENQSESSNLVECELIHPNQKVILSGVFMKGSNNSATRVCMSENACLKLINEYASKRDCTLGLGASSESASETQCTKIFPGSKGTCHNAAVISDDNVMGILNSMQQ